RRSSARQGGVDGSTTLHDSPAGCERDDDAAPPRRGQVLRSRARCSQTCSQQTDLDAALPSPASTYRAPFSGFRYARTPLVRTFDPLVLGSNPSGLPNAPASDLGTPGSTIAVGRCCGPNSARPDWTFATLKGVRSNGDAHARRPSNKRSKRTGGRAP